MSELGDKLQNVVSGLQEAITIENSRIEVPVTPEVPVEVPVVSPEVSPPTPTGPVVSVTPVQTPPFFQTAAGRAIVKIVGTGILSILSALLSNPDVTTAVMSIGIVNTILSIARDVMDSSIPNLPSSTS